ncbi:MAG: CDP-alcohol phosphatidyltransferase family protein [Lachnospiraceae bacterium]|nr:CDP-alcohol phosphatidyltransferase family protein [Lachnospiraceae bacterium]
MNKRKLVGFYNYTVLLTYTGFCFGIAGIIKALKGDVQTAFIFLMVSGFCDMFDGAVAGIRKKRTAEEKWFGACIDSLSDVVCFGLLPAVILYGFMGEGVVAYVAMFFFALCALIRLAYFDVQEITAQRKNGEKRTHFTGLPVTNAAIILPGIMVVDMFIGVSYKYVYLVSMLLVGAAYVTPFKMKKLYLPWILIPAAIGIGFFVLMIVMGGRLNAA